MNMNEVAKKVTLKEGLKRSVSIAQVKEVIKHLMSELSRVKDEEVLKILKKYKDIKKKK